MISLNGMYPFHKNQTDESMSDTMLDWLETLLSSSEQVNRKFIIFQHVYPGNDY
jgi:hypothetical protein